MSQEATEFLCFLCSVKMAVSFSLVGSFKGLSLSSNSSLWGDFSSLPVAPKFSVSFPLKSPLTIESAHKKGAGSTKNGRDSPGQRLGVKIYGDQVAKPGSIIVRQRGTKVSILLLMSLLSFFLCLKFIFAVGVVIVFLID